MSDCIFCKILAKEVPSQVVYEDDNVVAIKDIHPQAPVHIVVIPRKHIETLNAVSDYSLYGDVFRAIVAITKKLGIQQSGYRVVANCNKDGGQTVFHVHFHILGGQALSDKMS